MIANEYGISFLIDENVLNLIGETIELDTLNK